MASPATEGHSYMDKQKKKPKVLDHLRVKEAENGGHVVSHHFVGYDHEPEDHVFGAGQGKQMLAHVAEHMGVSTEPDGDEGEE